ncbi:MAG: GGDEF domain-containing protein [Agathobacter sp.]|uniref:GGDEF domain-containing protein n=1 Tax=Agathobacter sp. TaxID=2021311 RepID=UPI00257B6191|nr:GGDEF domain-containing protein [Agathobacter sp.]MBQ1682461.1 GGDEF domain-containing protein [Agathobacter sp.]
MITLDGWVVLNFFTAFLLILLLIFQNKTSRLKSGRKYCSILIMTLILIFAETIGRIGEMYPDHWLFLARIGYLIIFLFDPVDILFTLSYVDCWMDEENLAGRKLFRIAFQVFAAANILLVLISSIFHLKWFFYFEDMKYYRGSLFMGRGILLMVFIILLVAYVFIFQKNIMSEYKTIILFLPIFSLIGSVMQIFIAELDATYAGISLGCLILFFLFQSKDVNVDYLTGVLNRRGLDIKMQDMVKNSTLYGRDFTAIMMDIDNFKTVNDSFGHEAGDKAIKEVAEILVNTFGENAYIGRFGGDEFCVISDIIDRSILSEKIQSVRDAVARLRRKNGWAEQFDISCGYEVYHHENLVSAKQFQEQIDRLMYVEKQEHHGLQA